jgi:hypothetical protein
MILLNVALKRRQWLQRGRTVPEQKQWDVCVSCLVLTDLNLNVFVFKSVLHYLSIY